MPSLKIKNEQGEFTSIPYIKGDSGETGEAGFSPVATVVKEGNVVTITITDSNGTTTATVSDGSGGSGGSLELGETQDTAYRGDRGKISYDRSESVV